MSCIKGMMRYTRTYHLHLSLVLLRVDLHVVILRSNEASCRALGIDTTLSGIAYGVMPITSSAVSSYSGTAHPRQSANPRRVVWIQGDFLAQRCTTGALTMQRDGLPKEPGPKEHKYMTRSPRPMWCIDHDDGEHHAKRGDPHQEWSQREE